MCNFNETVNKVIQEHNLMPKEFQVSDKSIMTIKDLLTILSELEIPDYQRPYKWTERNLTNLLDDLRVVSQKRSVYRLGSIVFHNDKKKEKNKLDIVDGQQRTLTLILIVQALIEKRSSVLENLMPEDDLKCLKKSITDFLGKQCFSNDISRHNLYQNFMAAKRAVSRSDFTEKNIDFLLNACEVVTFVLTDVSEAFQFFDSQNARGRDLDPHDLLKAFHLREFSESEEKFKKASVEYWENLKSEDLEHLFANYLFRIRQWIQAKSARYFTKVDVDLFKGLNLEKEGVYSCAKPLLIAHHFVDEYNAQYQRYIDHQSMSFPFQLDQMLINGRRFFEMIDYYHGMIAKVVDHRYYDNKENDDNKPSVLGIELENKAIEIIRTLNSYSSRMRTGDRYVRSMFDCALIFYVDKFGSQQVSQAIEKLFIWAYTFRLRWNKVGLPAMDTHVLEHNVFVCIKQAVKPSDVFAWPLEIVLSKEQKATKVTEIEKLFEDMGYYEREQSNAE